MLQTRTSGLQASSVPQIAESADLARLAPSWEVKPPPPEPVVPPAPRSGTSAQPRVRTAPRFHDRD